MNHLTLNQRELLGEKLWGNYLINARAQFRNINQVTFLANFWANYEQLLTLEQVVEDTTDSVEKPSVDPVVFAELFAQYWAKPVLIHQYAQQQVKRKLSKTLLYALLALLVAPFSLIYLSKALGRLVVTASIVLVFYPREKAELKDQKNKIATYELNPQQLTYQSFQEVNEDSVVKIPYNKIHNLWHHTEGRLVVGENAQVQWTGHKGNHQHQIVIPNLTTQEWPKVREFLSNVAQQNMQLDT
ncbi:hypothetical protein BKI52_09550 [marine bacterium AO1-C]|nr:hypothetical protein BKI52_09550 [marine bacterium AO1-C]